ncbi:hypothetical protein JM654_23700 [Microbacterium oxydans]|nr:hypothetical protein [Microbacterium oxydans]
MCSPTTRTSIRSCAKGNPHPRLLQRQHPAFDNVGDVYDDASIYRPRFIDVQLEVTG